ncbi:reticulon-4-interacting protein 1, mitochondrial isoform X5 [Microplitis demolitor]|nr:reticulon-4-interacting protein 1, mitochondrial isoform X5 [Microplitis demolitor]XP_053597412.1 reticulon-4-interacting protein 1, mitochondrial isoform X5 [Microplitis demolitor]XP_053597419.1 reticulon-4-interacting protein 1, mitochondrial isoform X5 [Microplitis demolitor]
MNLMRRIRKLNEEIEFPLTTGRDFSGIVVAKGHIVGSKFELGDEVWGVVPVEQQGCHATHVVVDSDLVSPRPLNLSHIEASSILYAGLTAWSSLWVTGGLCCEKLMPSKIDKKVLILGGSGGVGTLAIQMAKAWNLQVISTCATDAVDLLKKLGADIVIDYKQNDADDLIVKEGIYDIILDCSNQGVDKIESKNYLFKKYITLNPPLLRNFDDYGIIGGTMNNLLDLFKYNIPKINNKSCVKWGFFVPSATGIRTLQKLVENQQLRPVIENVYQFDKLPEAYRRVAEGHLRVNSEANARRITMVENCFGSSGQSLAVPGRVLVGEGVLIKMCRKKSKPRQFFLFNDILVYGNIVINKKKYNKQHIIPLEEVKLESLADEAQYRNGWLIRTVTKSFAVYAATATEKQEWMAHITKCIEDLLRKSGKKPVEVHAAVWVPDNEATICMHCNKTQFTVLNRRHHCRQCGAVVCGPCSNKKLFLPGQGNGKAVRVCLQCYDDANKVKTSLTAIDNYNILEQSGQLADSSGGDSSGDDDESNKDEKHDEPKFYSVLAQ